MFTYQEFPAIKKVYRQQINYRQNPLLFNTIRYVVFCNYYSYNSRYRAGHIFTQYWGLPFRITLSYSYFKDDR
jgi:hypothetical protein